MLSLKPRFPGAWQVMIIPFILFTHPMVLLRPTHHIQDKETDILKINKAPIPISYYATNNKISDVQSDWLNNDTMAMDKHVYHDKYPKLKNQSRKELPTVNLEISHTQSIHDKMDNRWVTLTQTTDKEYHGYLVLYIDAVPGDHTIDLKISKSTHTRL